MSPTQSNPLQGLRDIHLPPPVSAWPPAPGWWILAALVIVLIVVALWWWRRYRRHAYRRAALAELQRLRQALQQGQTDTIMAELSILLRRTAMSVYGRDQVAALSGKDWLAFLDRTGRTTEFSKHGQTLLDAPYRRTSEMDAEPLLTLTQRWIQVQS